MQISKELLDSGLLDKYRNSAHYWAIIDYLNKEFGEIYLERTGNSLSVYSGKDNCTMIYLGSIFINKITNKVNFQSYEDCITFEPKIDTTFIANE